MSVVGEAIAQFVGEVVVCGWAEVTKATNKRFGWVAATIVAISPLAIIALTIWLIVVWVR